MLSLPLVRMVIFCTTDLFALIVLVLSAYALTQVAHADVLHLLYAYYCLAAAVLHLCSITPMIILGRIRNGFFTSRPAFEVGWLSFLWGMWAAAGCYAIPVLDGADTFGCAGPLCGAAQAAAAFAFLNWAMILGYVVTLITLAIKARKAGRDVWLLDVQHIRWSQGPGIDGDKLNLVAPKSAGAAYPPDSEPVGVVGSSIP